MPQANIYIHGTVGFDWWTDQDNSSQRVISDINAALADSSVDAIAIHINSVGGDVHEGLAIYNAIKNANKQTTCIIDGIAYSMAAIIAVAADKCLIAKNGLYMLHNASGMAWGNAKEFESTAETLKKYDNQLAVSIADKLGITVDECVAQWFNYEDNFFTAQEAIDAGIIDGYTEDEANIPADGIDNSQPLMKIAAQMGTHLKPVQNTWFKKLVQNVKNSLAADPYQLPPDNTTPINTDTMKISATLTSLLAFFGLQAADEAETVEHMPTEEQLTDLNARLAAAEDMQPLVDDLNTQVSDLTSERDNLQAEVARLGALTAQEPTPPSADPDPEPAPANEDEPSWVRNAKAHFNIK